MNVFRRSRNRDFKNLDEDEKIPAFLKKAKCKEILSDCRSAIVLKMDLSVKNAFDRLIENKSHAALLMDLESKGYVGMLTISDFINAFRYYQNNPEKDIRDIERQKTIDLRSITTVITPIIIPQDESLFEAARLLVEERVHRIIVTKDKRKFVLSKRRMLHHLHNNLFKKDKLLPSIMQRKIAQLTPALGTWENIATVTLKTKVTEALDLFCERRISALPVVDENGKVIDVFAKFDAFIAAKDQIHNMDMTVADALRRVKAKVHEGLFYCKLDENLLTVVDRFVAFKVHRLVVFNKNNLMVGMISLSDVLKLLSRQSLDNEIIPDFLKLSLCEDMMSGHGSVMTMTPKIWAVYGFQQLVSFNIHSVPLSDGGDLMGMLTISDFINVLDHCYVSDIPIEDIKNLQVEDFRSIMDMENEFIAIHPQASVFNAAELLLQRRVHRLPVTRGSCLFLLTKRMILKHLYEQLSERSKQRAFQRKTIADLKLYLGTWDNIATVKLETGIPDVLNLFCEREVSSLPVVDDNGKLIEIFSKTDVFALAANETYDNPHLLVAHALNQGWEKHEELRTCKLGSSLHDVLKIFGTEKIHRLVVVDKKMAVIGIISTSDMLKFLIRMPSESDIVEEAQEALEEALGGAVGGLAAEALGGAVGGSAEEVLEGAVGGSELG